MNRTLKVVWSDSRVDFHPNLTSEEASELTEIYTENPDVKTAYVVRER